MAQRDLPMAGGRGQNGGRPDQGAAVAHTRDAYRDVPILKRPTWGHEIAAYFFFGGISSGAAIIGSLASLVDGTRHTTLARTAHYVSLAALLPCPPLLIDDLGKPERFHHMLRVIKPSSPMNLGAWALTAHGGMATLTVGHMLAKEGKLPLLGPLARLLPERLLAAGALPSALALGGYTGVLLGTSSIPVWYTSPLLGALFMASSVSTGTAAVSLVGAATGREDPSEPRQLAAFELTVAATEASLLAGYLLTSGRAARPLLRGRHRYLLAGAAGALLLATLLQVVSLFGGPRGRGRAATLTASGATLAAGAMLRWAIVWAGRASADDREGTLAAMSPSADAPGWGP